ncbi:MAG: XRE family transcriptional regulator [Alphaproteobacteria bacterium]|nr:MAG: XRE family transcriptional regulator [Alphaproteobacteria bacterium]
MSSSRDRSPLPPDDPDFRYLARMMDILRASRELRGISKSELCRMSKCGNGTVGRAERYERFPSVPVLRRICRALDLEWAAVCRQAEPPTESHPL